MPRNHHTAIAPDGTVFKRTSANRVYTHMVTGQYDRAKQEREASSDYSFAADRREFIFLRIKAAATAGVECKVDMGDSRPWTKGGGFKQEEIDFAQRLVAPHFTGDEFATWRRQARLDSIAERAATGYYDKWLDLGWNGSLDLAGRGLGRIKGYINLRIIPAIMVVK